MKRISCLIGLGLFAAALTFVARADSKNNANRGQFSEKDFKFVCEAASGGMTEVKAGELAKTKSTDPDVKQFGEKMVTDHSKAADELKALATKKGATLPAEPENKHQRMLTKLEKLSGKEFDKAYVDDMVDDHKKDLKEFQEAAEKSDDPELRNFATKTATVIAQHLSHIERLSGTQK
jgi:putative membrane protein